MKNLLSINHVSYYSWQYRDVLFSSLGKKMHTALDCCENCKVSAQSDTLTRDYLRSSLSNEYISRLSDLITKNFCTEPFGRGIFISFSHAAGLDIAAASHWVCVGATPDGSDTVREFPAYTDGLQAIVAWLRDCGVPTVAMESTGIYWLPRYELLEAEGFEVLLVDPSDPKQVRGRPKTDRRACQWIQRLHAHGLLAAAFRPDELTCVLRSYLRLRANHVRYAGQHLQHMQKALEQMHLKLSEVVSDLTGVTGMSILQAMLRGERDPGRLATYRDRRCKASAETIARALNGSYRDEHLLARQQAVQCWECYQCKIAALDRVIAHHLQQLKKEPLLPPLPPKPRVRKRKPNEPRFDVRTALYYVTGADLTEIEGIDAWTALTVISEIGTDMTRWQTVKHFCSWLGLCPQHKSSGGKITSSRTRPGMNRAAAALCLGASSLHRSQSAMGAYFRRMKSRLGTPKAVTAHKLARILSHTLRYGHAYVKKTQEEYDILMRDRQIKTLKRRARMLGFEVVERVPPQPLHGAPADQESAPAPTA